MTAMLERSGRTLEARRILSAVEQVSYKGNWRFVHDELGEGNYDDVVPVAMVITVPDRGNPRRVGQLRYRIYVPLDSTDAEVHRILKLAVENAEKHELDEHFLVDGEELDPGHLPGEDPAGAINIWLTLHSRERRIIHMERRWVFRKDGKC